LNQTEVGPAAETRVDPYIDRLQRFVVYRLDVIHTFDLDSIDKQRVE
jgi:hypothetical protein